MFLFVQLLSFSTLCKQINNIIFPLIMLWIGFSGHRGLAIVIFFCYRILSENAIWIILLLLVIDNNASPLTKGNRMINCVNDNTLLLLRHWQFCLGKDIMWIIFPPLITANWMLTVLLAAISKSQISRVYNVLLSCKIFKGIRKPDGITIFWNRDSISVTLCIDMKQQMVIRLLKKTFSPIEDIH